MSKSITECVYGHGYAHASEYACTCVCVYYWSFQPINLLHQSILLNAFSDQTNLSRVQLVLDPLQLLLFEPVADEANSQGNDKKN